MGTLLEGIRVLDLATTRAELTGRMLADLGAEVLKVEPPQGVDARRIPPFESDDPGVLEGLGLGYADLRPLNPRLIHVSVTPYGQTGPKAQWPASDLTLQAAGGRVALQGDKDRPPL